MSAIHFGSYLRSGAGQNCCYAKKDEFIKIHSLFNHRLLNTHTPLKVIDSHLAYPHYNKTKDTIVLDTHFLDIMQIVSAVMVSEHYEVMDAVADLCVADYFICKGDVHIALIYAKSFSRNKEKIKSLIQQSNLQTKEIFYRQLLFVLGHEQGHALLAYNQDDPRFQLFRDYFDTAFEEDKAAKEIILSIDLTPIKADLDGLDRRLFDEPFDYSVKSYRELLRNHTKPFFDVLKKGFDLLDVPQNSAISRESAIYYACDCYLKGGGVKVLNRSHYEDDCIVDGYTLYRLITLQISDQNIESQIMDTVFAYFSYLLTMNIITCVDTCAMNIQAEGYAEEDLVWNRLHLESEMFNNTVLQYAFRTHGGLIAHISSEYAEDLLKIYNLLYARFCDRAYAIIHPTEDMPYCPYGSVEYKDLYHQISSMLML